MKKIYFALALLFIFLFSEGNPTADSLLIDPETPGENDPVRVESYITIPNCCSHYDSVNIAKNLTAYTWVQTKCSDPWHTGEGHTDEQTVDSLCLYLGEMDIVPGHITITYHPELSEDCEACICQTGNIILVYVPTDDSATMSGLGFAAGDPELNTFITSYHTDYWPQCDCYCQCADTVRLGTLQEGAHRLVFKTLFFEAQKCHLLYSVSDTIIFGVGNVPPVGLPGNSNASLSVFPNPTNGRLHLSHICSDCAVTIFDMMGRVVLEADQDPINVEPIPAGSYMVFIRKEGRVIHTQQLTIMRQ